MRRQIEHVRLQWLGFKAPTSATRPGVAYRIVSRRNVHISRRAQLVSSTRIHFRIRRNQKWPGLASKPLDHDGVGRPTAQAAHEPCSHASPSREVRRGSAAMPRQAAEEARTPTPAPHTPAAKRGSARIPSPTAPSGSAPRRRRQARGDRGAAALAGGRGWRPQARGPLQASFVNMLICPVALFAFKPVVSTRSPGASSPRTRPQYPVRPPLTCGGNGPHGRMRRGDDRPDPGKALGGPNKATAQGLRRPQGGQRYPNLRRCAGVKTVRRAKTSDAHRIRTSSSPAWPSFPAVSPHARPILISHAWLSHRRLTPPANRPRENKS
jgi:hypothetical protein